MTEPVEPAVIVRAYRSELDPTIEQRKLMSRQAGCARFAFNWGLARWRERYEAYKQAKARGEKDAKAPSWQSVHTELTAAKKDPELSWLRDASAYAVREAVSDVGSAYKHFFRRMRQHQRGDHRECAPRRGGGCNLGEPDFRSKKDPSGRGFRVAQPNAVSVVARNGESVAVKIAGIGAVKLRRHGYIPLDANYRGLSVREIAGRWFVAVQVQEGNVAPSPDLSTRTGVEVGVRVSTVTSAGTASTAIRDLPNFDREQRKLALWSRRMARRHVKGKPTKEQSRGWHECVRRVQECHLRISDMRKDALHKATTNIVQRAKGTTLVLRDARVKGMLMRAGKTGPEARKRNRIAPLLAQAGMFELRRQIEYKQTWSGGTVVIAPNNYPSTRRCSRCGHVRDTDPGYPNFRCMNETCGAVLDREENSAINLRDFVPAEDRGNGSGGGIDRRKTAQAAQRPAEPESSAEACSMAPMSSPDDGGAVSAAPVVLGPGNRAGGEQSPFETGGDSSSTQPETLLVPHRYRSSSEVPTQTRVSDFAGLRAKTDGGFGAARSAKGKRAS